MGFYKKYKIGRKLIVMISRAFGDIEGAIDLFGEYKASEVVGENEIAEFDAGYCCLTSSVNP